MIKPLRNYLLVEKKQPNNKNIIYMLDEDDHIYHIVEVGPSVDQSLLGKDVFVKDNLHKIEHNFQTFYIVSFEDCLAILCED